MKLTGVLRRRELATNGSKNTLPNMAQQQFRDETDINKIMKKYHATGMITHLARNPGRYADLSTIKDYAQSLQTVIDAQGAFNILPSEIRNRFQNDPNQLLAFIADENNREEAIKLKIINPPPPKETPTNPPPPINT